MKAKNLSSKISERKKIQILLCFTRELIKNSGEEVFRLEDIVSDEMKGGHHRKPLVNIKPHEAKIHQAVNGSKDLKEQLTSKILKKMKPKRPLAFSNQPLHIPKPKLPARFDYLKPTPTNLEIDLGILNPFLKDPLVTNIECNGPGQNVHVIGTMGRKKTNVFLDEAQIEEVVRRFSETTKIPFQEGIFRVVAGKLIFSAIISQNIGSKFMIKKMIYNPGFRR